MKADIEFDSVNREVVLKNGDFSLTPDNSVQCGQILLWSKAAFCLNPTLGVGIGGLIGSEASEVNYECNRWKQQATGDGATSASFQLQITVGSEPPINITTQISYD